MYEVIAYIYIYLGRVMDSVKEWNRIEALSYSSPIFLSAFPSLRLFSRTLSSCSSMSLPTLLFFHSSSFAFCLFSYSLLSLIPSLPHPLPLVPFSLSLPSFSTSDSLLFLLSYLLCLFSYSPYSLPPPVSSKRTH